MVPEKEGFLLAWRTPHSIFCCLLIFLEDKLCSWASSAWQRLVPQVQASSVSHVWSWESWVRRDECTYWGVDPGPDHWLEWTRRCKLHLNGSWCHLSLWSGMCTCLHYEGGLNAWLKGRHEPGDMAVLAPLEAFLCAANPASFPGPSIPFTAASAFSMPGLLHLNISTPHNMMFGSCGPASAVTCGNPILPWIEVARGVGDTMFCVYLCWVFGLFILSEKNCGPARTALHCCKSQYAGCLCW